MPHTYAILEVSRECYEEIEDKLKEAGRSYAIFHDQVPAIDMHGIAIQKENIDIVKTAEKAKALEGDMEHERT